MPLKTTSHSSNRVEIAATGWPRRKPETSRDGIGHRWPGLVDAARPEARELVRGAQRGADRIPEIRRRRDPERPTGRSGETLEIPAVTVDVGET